MTEQDHIAAPGEKKLSRLDVWAIAFGCMAGWGSFVIFELKSSVKPLLSGRKCRT